MMHLLILVNILMAFMTSQTTCSILNQQTFGRDGKKEVHKRNPNLQVGNILQNRLAGQAMARILNNTQWSQFTPNTPAPEEEDCQIEIEVTQLVGGRCVRLGGFYRMAVCQSGVHLDFTRNQCEQILTQREVNAQAHAEGQVAAHAHAQPQQLYQSVLPEQPVVKKRYVNYRNVESDEKGMDNSHLRDD